MINFKKYINFKVKQSPTTDKFLNHRDKKIAKLAHEFADSGEYWMYSRLTREVNYYKTFLDKNQYVIWDNVSKEAFKHRGYLNCSREQLSKYAECKNEEDEKNLSLLLNLLSIKYDVEKGYYTEESKKRAEGVYKLKLRSKTQYLIKKKKRAQYKKKYATYYARKAEYRGYVKQRCNLKLYTSTSLQVMQDILEGLLSHEQLKAYVLPSPEALKRQCAETRLANQPAYKKWHEGVEALLKAQIGRAHV